MSKKRKTSTPLSVRQERKKLKAKKLVVATFDDDDSPICVVRPAKPEEALRLTHEFLKRPQREKDALWEEHIQALHETCGPYEFVGYMTTNRDDQGETILVDPADGEYAGIMKKGDSLVHEDSIEEVEMN